MAFGTWIDDENNTYSAPYIAHKIVGFHGIDPDLVSSSGSGSTGIDDHEQLNNLLGGDNTGHWHVNAQEYERLIALLSGGGTSPLGNSNYSLFHLLNNLEYDGLKELFSTLGIQSSYPSISSKSAKDALNNYIDNRIAAYLAANP